MMTHPISRSSVSISLSTLSFLLDLTERRVQQLAREGIVVRKKAGCYDLIASIQGYIRYLRTQAQKKVGTLSEAELVEHVVQVMCTMGWIENPLLRVKEAERRKKPVV